MIDSIIEVLAGIFPVGVGSRRGAGSKAYKRAWRIRQSTANAHQDVLVAELKRFSVPGAYGPPDSAPISVFLAAWRVGIPPKKLRSFIKSRCTN